MRELGVFPWVLVAVLVHAWVRRPEARRALVARALVYAFGLATLLALGARLVGTPAPLARIAIVAALQAAVVLPFVAAANGATATIESLLPRRRPRLRRALAAFVGQGLVFAIGLPLLVLSLALRRANGQSQTSTQELGLPVTPVTFAGYGGTTLRGVWLRAPRRRGVVLLVHGLAADKLGFLEATRPLTARGYDVFSFDQRGHGESGGHTTTLGAIEQDDVRAAWRVVLERTRGEDIPRVILGISLGGAAVQLAAPDLDAVDGLLLDSTFARAEAPARRHLALPEPIAAVALAIARLVAVPLTGHAVLDVAPIDAVRRNKGTYAVTLVHARGDPLIPFEEALALREAYGPRATLVPIEAAIHPATFAAPPAYENALIALAKSAESRHPLQEN